MHDLSSNVSREVPRTSLDNKAPTALAFLYINNPVLLSMLHSLQCAQGLQHCVNTVQIDTAVLFTVQALQSQLCSASYMSPCAAKHVLPTQCNYRINPLDIHNMSQLNDACMPQLLSPYNQECVLQLAVSDLKLPQIMRTAVLGISSHVLFTRLG